MNFQIGQIQVYVSGFHMTSGKVGFDLKIKAPIGEHEIVIESTYRQMDENQPLEVNIGVNKRHEEKSIK